MCAQKTKKTQSTSQNALMVAKAADFQAVPERSIDKAAFAISIRTLLQNGRQGTVGCKGRADVNFSNKKPWKQKGTGRARAGSARSPLWIGGGVIFGPQPRTRTLKISKDLKRGVLNTLFWNYLEKGSIGVLDWQLSNDLPKTAHAHQALKDAQLIGKRIILFLSTEDMVHYASFVNIPDVNVVLFDDANAYSIVRGDQWVVLKKDLDLFKKMVATWS
ncbi:MAG TPA: 50S ribosomal protein L4 [Candidatus Babeliales bacterium]|nr:50S ribosomal protein L4 [Candidatus Babeliales bacterium]